MDRDRRLEVSRIFQEALDVPEDARPALLDRLCSADPSLRLEVETLLRAAPGADALFRSQLGKELLETATSVTGDAIGRRVGPYRLVRLIGSGGMGAVYLGERDDPQLRMQVAIKLARPGLASAPILDRLRVERQLLAELHHPNIARLLDGGATEDGLPFLVMEYVEGVSLDRYCQDTQIDLRRRLVLFRSICSAVHYAHQNLVVHRDLKPSNILVDEHGQVKLLDFGIAKVLSERSVAADAVYTMPAETTVTLLHAMTPRYASPEQVRGERITTGTDVYSLGIILYQLLTDRLPYEVDGKSPADVVRIICEQDPTPPSVATGRGKLSKDLDTIVLKALRKEPERRYASVEELSEDVRRYMEGLPVSARPDTLRYRLGKFAGRHKVLVGSLAAILILLTTGLTVSLALYRQAVDARAEADVRREQAEWLAYASSLTAAEGAIRGNQADEARRQLEQSSAHLRGWEWHHLQARMNRGTLRFNPHKRRIADMVYSADGGLLVTASVDGSAKVFSSRTGEVQRSLPHPAWVESADIAPSGSLVATACRDSTVRLWDIRNGILAESVRTSAIPIAARFHSEEQILVALQDGHVLVLGVPKLAVSKSWDGTSAGLSALALSPDGRHLALGHRDGVLSLWGAPSWDLLRSRPANKTRIVRIAFSPDGSLLATGSLSGEVSVWGVEDGREVATYHGFEGMVGPVTFDSSGTRVLAGDSNGSTVIFDARTAEDPVQELRGVPDAVSTAARSPHGPLVATATVSGSVVLWPWYTDDVRLFLPAATGPERNYVMHALASPDEARVATASRTSGVDVWSSLTGKHLFHIDAGGGPGASRVAFTPDGRLLFAAHEAGSITVTETETGHLQQEFSAHEPMPALASDIDGNLVIGGLDVSPDGTLLLTASADSTVKLWQLPPARPTSPPGPGSAGPSSITLRTTLRGHSGRVLNAHFSPDGAQIGSCSADGTLRIWDIVSGREVGVLRGHKAYVMDLAFDPHGDRVASASRDGSVRLWDLATQSESAQFVQGSLVMTAVAFSSDGTRLAAGGVYKSIALFDAHSGREIVKLHEHVGRIRSLQFSKKDSFLLSSSIDGSAALWDAPESIAPAVP